LCQQNSPLLIIKQNHLLGLIDTSGAIILPPNYESIEPDAQKSIYKVGFHGRKALFSNESRSFITEFYDDIIVVNPFRFIVVSGGYYGILNDSNRFIVAAEFSNIAITQLGKYICIIGHQIFLYNQEGICEKVFNADDVVEYRGCYITQTDNLFGLTDRNGESLLPAVYDSYKTGNDIICLKKSDSTAYYHIAARKILMFDSLSIVDFRIESATNYYALPFYSVKSNGKKFSFCFFR
jgi:hypothetical protein